MLSPVPVSAPGAPGASRAPVCLALLGVGRSQISALRHHAGFDLRPLAADTPCGWMVVGPDAIARLKDVASFDRWRFVGTLRRPSSASDDLLLFQRTGP